MPGLRDMNQQLSAYVHGLSD